MYAIYNIIRHLLRVFLDLNEETEIKNLKILLIFFLLNCNKTKIKIENVFIPFFWIYGNKTNLYRIFSSGNCTLWDFIGVLMNTIIRAMEMCWLQLRWILFIGVTMAATNQSLKEVNDNAHMVALWNFFIVRNQEKVIDQLIFIFLRGGSYKVNDGL